MKFRSRTNYAQIYAGDKQGFNLGLDGAIYLRREAVSRTFQLPRIGTQGKSLGAVSASTDISGGTDNALKINVRGKGVVTATIASVAGLNTGALIAAALETAINNALAAAGFDERVWVDFTVSDTHYTVYDQQTGLASTVVITDAASNNVADDLNLGTANGGTETAGTDDQDFLLFTTGGPTFNQPVESNMHRSGRYHVGVVKKKKVATFNFSTFINMRGSAGDSIDGTVRLLWENLLGKETVNAGVSIDYEQGLPNFTFSLARVSTIFGEYYTGAYVRENDLTFPGAGPATCAWQGKASTRVIAGLAQVNGAISNSTAVVLNAGEADRYDAGAYVMAVKADGRTIAAGADGGLTIASVTDDTNLVLSAPITLDDDGFLVPWNPGAVQQTGRDNIYTDLEGTFKLKSTGSRVDVTNVSLKIANDHNDLDGYFGRDSNQGFVAGQRMTATLSVTFDLSNENFAEVVQSSKFAGFDPYVELGQASGGLKLAISTKKWIPAVPNIELPENGPTPVTLEGVLYQSAPGAQDPLKVSFAS